MEKFYVFGKHPDGRFFSLGSVPRERISAVLDGTSDDSGTEHSYSALKNPGEGFVGLPKKIKNVLRKYPKAVAGTIATLTLAGVVGLLMRGTDYYSGFKYDGNFEGDFIRYKENSSGSRAKMVVQRGGYVWELYDDKNGTSVNSRENFGGDSLERVVIKPVAKSRMPDGRKSWNFDREMIGDGTIDGERTSEVFTKGDAYFAWAEERLRERYDSGISAVFETLSVPDFVEPIKK